MSTAELYLSRAVLRVDPHSTARGVTVAYLLHQATADLFGQYHQRQFLYRVDAQHHDAHVALILSTHPPSSPDAPRAPGVSLEELATKPFEIRVAQGTMLDFEIRLNATRDLHEQSGHRSRRIDVWEAVWRADHATSATPHEVYGEYLRRKLHPTAHVHEARVTARGLVRARAGFTNRRAITHVAANVVGTLEVIDAAALTTTIQRGIGRSKAFGCGLLCLSRPGSVLPRRYAISAHETTT